ncbi:hypothetical protein NC653_038932 [Populus alba x Populus x berolinensis]|uniref:Uncharacterized protein n=1 Tax=Populus alba x Populus x berolinensis TaxID=444605 RepID=A0AAD6LBL7_9ROSI|nr:hypothetical protein NC653_038932 [Populus alba x Populus x berolinensis]
MENSKCIGGGQGRCIERGQHFRWMGFFRFSIESFKNRLLLQQLVVLSLSLLFPSQNPRREAITVQ